MRLSPSSFETRPVGRPIKQMQLARFNGTNWELFGELLSEE